MGGVTPSKFNAPPSAPTRSVLDSDAGSGEDTNHPTDEAGPKPFEAATQGEVGMIKKEKDPSAVINDIFDETVHVTAGHDETVEVQIWRAVKQGRLSKRKAKQLRNVQAKVRVEYIDAAEKGEDIEVFIRRITTEVLEGDEDGLDTLCSRRQREGRGLN